MSVARRARWVPAAEGVSALLLVVAAIYIMRGLALQDGDDDQYFLHALDQRGLLEFLAWRYQGWTGRVLIEALLVTTIGTPAVWTLGIPLALLGSAWAIWRLALFPRMPVFSGTLSVLALLWLVSRMVLQDAAFWVTGFYNYLLPCALGLLAMTVLSDVAWRRGPALLPAMVAMVIACQAEQVAFVLLTCLLVRALLRRASGEGTGAEVVAMLAGGASALVSGLAPGNALRLVSELRWFPEFADAGLIEKLAFGPDRASAHAHSPRNVMIVMVAGLAAWATWRACRTPTARLAAAILWLFVASAFGTVLIRVFGLEGMPRITGVAAHLVPAEWMQVGIFASLGFTICVYGALATAAACRARDLPALLAGAGLPLLALAATMLVALSPTIYASGFRILFVGDLLLVLHGAMVLSELLDRRHAASVPDAADTMNAAAPEDSERSGASPGPL